jgi:hypothetical protein
MGFNDLAIAFTWEGWPLRLNRRGELNAEGGPFEDEYRVKTKAILP